MTTSPMILLATVSVAALEPISRMPEVPELASMALLSVVLVGMSMVVRRTPSGDAAHDDGAPTAGAARRR